jgi:signal transduction histidine kinase
MTVTMTATLLEIQVEDDGIGLHNPTRSSGLSNLRHRAERHGGTFDITTSPQGGTSLRWTVPRTS